MTLINKKYIFFIFMFSMSVVFLFPPSHAETQVPGIAVGVESDPYYFSDRGFGVDVLKYYGIPLTPYLTPETTEASSSNDILNSYSIANKNTTVKAIVNDNDRAKYYLVHFWNTSNGSKTFTTFTKFQPIIIKNPLTPIGSQKYSTGFSLESLPTKNKQWFYNSIIKEYINPTKSPQPFNADIDLVTGDGNILQTYQYQKCQVNGYVPFLSEILLRLQFTKQFHSEVRDRTDFTCDGFKINFDLRNPSADWTSIQSTVDSIPDQKDLVQKYIVSISSDIFKSGQTYQTFSKFTPMGVQDNIPLSIATNPVSGKSKSFSLESLPSKDKELFYQYVIDKLNNKRQVQPIDISVDLVTGNGTVLQTWKYPKCDVTNYSIYRQEISATWKFKNSSGAEIRDKIFLTCNGLQVNFIPHSITQAQNYTSRQDVPVDKDRAQVFTIHFSGGPLKNSFNYTFLKFAPYSNFKFTPDSKEYSFNLPDYSFGNTPRFYVESMPSKDESDLYKLIGNYINPRTPPQQFDAVMDLTSGDGSILETWTYTKCDITKYGSYFQDILQVNMFTEKFKPEIRDRVFFQCAGLSLKDGKDTINSNNTSMIQPIKFVPNDKDRAQIFVVKFSNGDLRITHPFYTFSDFRPDLSASDQVKTYYPQIKSASFALASLPSKDKADYYKFLSHYVNPTQKPEPFDVTIEEVTLDGTVVETWQYQKCNVIDYQTFLQNTLLYYTMSGKKAISEVQDKTTFQCSGFYINFEQGKEDLSKQSIISSNDIRVMTYVVQLTSDEFPTTRFNGLVQKFDTLGNQQFQLESLPNKFSKGGYQVVSKYINPGTKPELFDVNLELITGDGTKLYSIKYAKCRGIDYSIFLDDNILNIKFSSPIKFETRDKSIVQCSGVNAIVPSKDSSSNIIGPIVQKAIGISDNQIACNQDFQLMVRPPHENIICVKIDHVSAFTQRGWHTTTSNQSLSNAIKPIIPTVDERAMAIRTTFQGSEIATQTLQTFSKFVPISKNSSTDPSHPLSGNTPLFYLESVPSKDKSDVYHLISMYINPGMKPDPFDVKVEILNGNNSTLQTWNFIKCQITNYNLYLDENAMTYKYHLRWQSEIRDRTTFSCAGFNLGLG